MDPAATRAEPPLRHFLATLAYEGAPFHGWQIQPGAVTVQGTVEGVLQRILGRPVRVRAAGRTDAGVHALGQRAGFSAATRLPAAQLRRALNALLPASVRAVALEETPAPVDPRRAAWRKTYVYQLHVGRELPPHRRHHFALSGGELDVAAMREAARRLVGEHDFTSFARAQAARRGAVRRLDAVRIRVIPSGVRLFFTGSGFLYNMARTLAAALLAVGRRRLGPDDVARMLDARRRDSAPATLPPEGLWLWRVDLDAGRAGARRRHPRGSDRPATAPPDPSDTKGRTLSISITVRHGDAPDDLQGFADEKASALGKFLRSEPRLEFVLEKLKLRWTGEVILHGSRHHERLVARDEHADPHGCVEKLLEKLARQLEKGKERRKDHRGPSFAGPGPDGSPPAAGDEPSYDDVVRDELRGPKNPQ